MKSKGECNELHQNFYPEILLLFDDRETKWGLVNEIDGENSLRIITAEDTTKIETLEDFLLF